MILEKIKTVLFNLKRNKNIKGYWESENGFDMLLSDLNEYFKDKPELAEKYNKELSFINSSFKTLPEIKKVAYAIIPYSFILNYDYRLIEVFKCSETAMHYVYLDNKKLYFPNTHTLVDIQKNYTFLQVEQDKNSPHRYLDSNFEISENDIVADIGAAEGNFSLSIVEKAKKIVIIEGDTLWSDALRKTFEPWKEKVILLNKMISSKESIETISLNKLCSDFGITALKMDIEGSELSVLKTAKEYISNNQLKMAVTTYHNQMDAENIKTFLESLNYKIVFTPGFMLFIHDLLKPPFFRKALIKTITS